MGQNSHGPKNGQNGTTRSPLQAPFPWFGGKSRAAALVWARFGYVPNYVEPFFGSGAILLGRPNPANIETVNDLDGYICNFWRAVRADPQTVAEYADGMVNESDMHARHIWLVNQKDSLVSRLEGDPMFYDAKIAGWWVYGMSLWIGGGFCSGVGPWHAVHRKRVHLADDGRGVHRKRVHLADDGRGVHRKRVHLGAGMGVQRQRVHLGDGGMGVHRQIVRGVKRQRVHLGAGLGVQRQLVHLGGGGMGIKKERPSDKPRGITKKDIIDLQEWFQALAVRFRRVRVCCGDWRRICTPICTYGHGLTGVLLDPPYSAMAGRDNDIYSHDSTHVALDARQWALENGNNRLMRIALCGYDGEYTMPKSWECVQWKASGGYANLGANRKNKHRERIWFSPHCLKV